jgi:hypothetical protein
MAGSPGIDAACIAFAKTATRGHPVILTSNCVAATIEYSTTLTRLNA